MLTYLSYTPTTITHNEDATNYIVDCIFHSLDNFISKVASKTPNLVYRDQLEMNHLQTYGVIFLLDPLYVNNNGGGSY